MNIDTLSKGRFRL